MMNIRSYMPPLFLAMGMLLSGVSQASEFRSFRPVLTPSIGAATVGTALRSRSVMKPVSRDIAGKAMEKIIAAWNENSVGSVLGDDFFDKSRVDDAMNAKVPRDARIEVLAIRSVQTLGQQIVDSAHGRLLVSRVSVTARTQLTFNDPTNGYQRREGTNEYILRIKQRLR